jgi:hypothetical protein
VDRRAGGAGTRRPARAGARREVATRRARRPTSPVWSGRSAAPRPRPTCAKRSPIPRRRRGSSRTRIGCRAPRCSQSPRRR